MDTFCSFIVLIFCFTLNQDILCSTPSAQEKIVGGYITTIEEFPYMAFVWSKENNIYRCGASILNRKCVLTAAHCLDGMSSLTIRIGSTQAREGGKVYNASKLLIHPEYNSTVIDYDVGIITVSGEMELDGVTAKAVELPDSNLVIEPGTEILVSGWGAIKEGGALSDTLRVVKVPTISNEVCNLPYENKITDRMICAGFPKGGKDSCQGDSGGPAVRESDRVQIGIVSFGKGCARRNAPGVYTRVPSVIDWIRDNIPADRGSKTEYPHKHTNTVNFNNLPLILGLESLLI